MSCSTRNTRSPAIPTSWRSASRGRRVGRAAGGADDRCGGRRHRQHPARAPQGLDLVAESVRRAVRAAANEAWGKKPLVTVFVTRCSGMRNANARTPEPCRARRAGPCRGQRQLSRHAGRHSERAAGAAGAWRDAWSSSMSATPRSSCWSRLARHRRSPPSWRRTRRAACIISATRWTTSSPRATGCKAEGARILGDGNPKTGAHGKPVLFLHPKDFFGTLSRTGAGGHLRGRWPVAIDSRSATDARNRSPRRR